MITPLLCLVLLVLDRTGHGFTTNAALCFAAATLTADWATCILWVCTHLKKATTGPS